MCAALNFHRLSAAMARRLELLVVSGTVSSSNVAALLQETSELLAIFTTISKKTKARIS